MSQPNNPDDHSQPAGKKVDESWKEEARRAKEAPPKPSDEPHPPGALPKPDFSFIVNSLAMQVLMSLGHIPGPMSEEVEVDLEQAKHGIDILDMLAEKTKGNLTDPESRLLDSTLYDLRIRYIALSQHTPGL